MPETRYHFIDKTGHCFDDYAAMPDDTTWHKQIAGLLFATHEKKHSFSVGDMLAFRDDLTNDGFVWGVDFYVIKAATPK